jgi:hypothetical protein
MPLQFGSQGLILPTQAELQAQYGSSMMLIYGPDINLGPETPDGQMLNIFTQAVLDLQDLLLQIYNGFDPDLAIGDVLDQRVAINGIQRQAGTFTVVPVTVVVTQSVNLYGLDQTANPVYTVSDSAGNQYELQETQLGIGPGSPTLNFQAAVPGAVTPTPNSITVPVTIVLGVQSVNNAGPATSVGINEETDAQLRVRRQQSVTLPSQGFVPGLEAALKNLPGVTYATVIENDTSSTDGYGIPGHTIWVIVAGSGSPASIAKAIYVERSMGCGLFASGQAGQETYVITQPDGSTFTVYWDDVIAEALFTMFTATSLNGSTPPNYAGIIAQLPNLLTPGPNGQVNVNELATLVQDIDPNTLVTAAGFSTSAGGSYTTVLSPSSPNKQFQLSGSDIIIYPIMLLPATSTVATGSPVAFSVLGGYPTYTYAIAVNNSGGTINSSTGAYTAGATPSVTDTVVVTDNFSQTGTAFVVVT